MKNTQNCKIVTEFLRLRTNVYTYIVDKYDVKLFKKVKGINKSIIKDCATHREDDVFMNDNQIRYKVKSIVSQNHSIHSVEVVIIAFVPFDDKDTQIVMELQI